MSHQSLFELSKVPFSSFESWMSISIPLNSTEIYFRNHHIKANDLFSLKMKNAEAYLKPSINAQATNLTLTHDKSSIEICYEGASTIRFKGCNVDFELAGEAIHAYLDNAQQAVFSCPTAARRYQIDVMTGKLQLSGAYSAVEEDLDNMAAHQGGVDDNDIEDREQQVILITPDEFGEWEFAIDEFWSSWVQPERENFQTCKQKAKSNFNQFKDSLPQSCKELSEAHELATYINYSCAVGPTGLIKRPTLFMSKNWMNNVWSWDQCYNAISLASGQPKLAMDQMLTLVDHQDEFGAYPDCFNDVHIQYNFSKPPVHGLAYSEILKRLPAPLDDKTKEVMYQSLSAQVNWWMKYRKKDNQDLPTYLHGNDSGWDNSTMFSKGVPLQAPDLASLLIIQMDVLSKSAEDLNKIEESKTWHDRADALFNALMKELWIEDHFVAKLANCGTIIESQSLIPWLCIILGDRLPKDKQTLLKNGLEKHLTQWGLATEHPESPNYIKDGYWRGPIWAPSTFLAITGLDKCGFSELADTIAQRFCELCKTSGFAENFNAQTGEPLRDQAYTWTSSIFLILAERLNK